jgi:enoyl-CoA hydratase
MLIMVEKHADIALIRLAHPPVNALSEELRQDLAQVLDDLCRDPAIGAVILTGDNSVRDIFCGGSDITEFELSADSRWGGERAKREMARIDHIRGQRSPLIAAVNGPALGGGLELVLACDVIIASDTATFGFPEIKLGVFPGSHALSLATRILGVARTRLLSLTGQRVGAEWMERAGLVSEIVPRDQLLVRAMEIARDIASHSQHAVRSVRDITTDIIAPSAAESRLIGVCCDAVTRSPEAKRQVEEFFASRRQPKSSPATGGGT